MPGDSDHPVTVLGDLRVQYVPNPPLDDMPDLRPATIADLVSALRAEGMLPEDTLVIERVGRVMGGKHDYWPDWALKALSDLVWRKGEEWPGSVRLLDALAEAAKERES